MSDFKYITRQDVDSLINERKHDSAVIFLSGPTSVNTPISLLKESDVISVNGSARYLIENDYIISAPFKEIQHIFRLGENYSQPDIIAFRKKTRILETAIEVPLADVTNKAFDIAYPIMRKAALQTLLAVASKYSLPDQFLKDVLSASFPKNLYEETLEYEKKGLQLYYAWLAKQKE